jgi:hypothetical protein
LSSLQLYILPPLYHLHRHCSFAANMTSKPITILKAASKSTEGRPSSVPPSHNMKEVGHVRSLSMNPPRSRMASEPQIAMKEPVHETSLDLTGLLERSEPSVVKNRTGSVLTRGFILKTDYYPSGASCNRIAHKLIPLLSGRALDLELNIHGAPNFRAPRQGAFNVFGAAQPRTQGLRAILSILRCRPGTPNPSHVVWFSTREEPIGKCHHSWQQYEAWTKEMYKIWA